MNPIYVTSFLSYFSKWGIRGDSEIEIDFSMAGDVFIRHSRMYSSGIYFLFILFETPGRNIQGWRKEFEKSFVGEPARCSTAPVGAPSRCGWSQQGCCSYDEKPRCLQERPSYCESSTIWGWKHIIIGCHCEGSPTWRFHSPPVIARSEATWRGNFIF